MDLNLALVRCLPCGCRNRSSIMRNVAVMAAIKITAVVWGAGSFRADKIRNKKGNPRKESVQKIIDTVLPRRRSADIFASSGRLKLHYEELSALRRLFPGNKKRGRKPFAS